MSILMDWEIDMLCKCHGLVTPRDAAMTNPASLDLRLGNEWVNIIAATRTTTDEIFLAPNETVLAHTAEYIKMPERYAAQLRLKSSMARRGIAALAGGWIDPGFEGTLTLALHSYLPLTLRAGEPVVQMIIYSLNGRPDHPYNGRYQGDMLPTRAKKESTQR